MAKNNFPMAPGGGGFVSKLVGVAVTIAVLAFVVKHPADAADWLTGAFALLGNIVDGLAAFFSALHG